MSQESLESLNHGKIRVPQSYWNRYYILQAEAKDPNPTPAVIDTSNSAANLRELHRQIDEMTYPYYQALHSFAYQNFVDGKYTQGRLSKVKTVTWQDEVKKILEPGRNIWHSRSFRLNFEASGPEDVRLKDLEIDYFHPKPKWQDPEKFGQLYLDLRDNSVQTVAARWLAKNVFRDIFEKVILFESSSRLKYEYFDIIGNLHRLLGSSDLCSSFNGGGAAIIIRLGETRPRIVARAGTEKGDLSFYSKYDPDTDTFRRKMTNKTGRACGNIGANDQEEFPTAMVLEIVDSFLKQIPIKEDSAAINGRLEDQVDNQPISG